MKLEPLSVGETVIGAGLIAAFGLAIVMAGFAAFGAAQAITEDLVYEQNVGPLHVIKVWEGEFSLALGTFRKYRWRVLDLDDKKVMEGYADTLQEAIDDAGDAVPDA
jgi:hypothetical protein